MRNIKMRLLLYFLFGLIITSESSADVITGSYLIKGVATNNGHLVKNDSIEVNYSLKNNGKLNLLTNLDYSIFEKIIYYSDSMRLKDFHYLRSCLKMD